MPELAKASWHVDRWTDEAGCEMEIIDHGLLVEIVNLSGQSIWLSEADARRVYAGLERWLASLPQQNVPR